MLVFACAVAVLLAGFYVLTPLFRESEGQLEAELDVETDLDRLLNRKAVIYGNLKDLEFEYRMGRLAETDFSAMAAGYKQEAAAILQQLDRLGAESGIDESIEKEVSLRKARMSAPSGKQTLAAARCPSCGSETLPEKKFCADCGCSLQG